MAGSENLTKEGSAVGTLRYIAPEQLKDKATTQSDLYSLGAILYEMLTLRSVVPIETPELDAPKKRIMRQMVHDILQEEALPPRELTIKIQRPIDKRLEKICLKAIHKNLEIRYSDARSFYDDLEKYQGRKKKLIFKTIGIGILMAIIFVIVGYLCKIFG